MSEASLGWVCSETELAVHYRRQEYVATMVANGKTMSFIHEELEDMLEDPVVCLEFCDW